MIYQNPLKTSKNRANPVGAFPILAPYISIAKMSTTGCKDIGVLTTPFLPPLRTLKSAVFDGFGIGSLSTGLSKGSSRTLDFASFGHFRVFQTLPESRYLPP